MQQDFYRATFGISKEQANYVFEIIGNFLHLAVERYLQDKSFYTKQEFLEFLEKNIGQEQNKGITNVAKLSALLNYPMIFEIKIKWKKKVSIITSSMILQDFVVVGFVSYAFRSKYFWGYDKVLWSLNKYKTIINVYTKISDIEQDVNIVTQDRKLEANKFYALCKNNFPTRFLGKKSRLLNYLGILERFFEVCEFYKVGQFNL